MKKLNSHTFSQMILYAAERLDAESAAINNLNVFPVPDGDTGSNMTMTISGVLSLDVPENSELYKVAKKSADLMLRSARGNSGVILSVFFKGFAKGLGKVKEATAADISAALVSATSAAYGSVMKPTEGTILTVMRSTSTAASVAVEKNKDITLEELFDTLCVAAKDSLDKTPELLPMLKEAGVIDAGGCGFYTVLVAMTAALKGEAAPSSLISDKRSKQAKAGKARTGAAACDNEIVFPYCTECIVEKSPEYAGEDKCGDLYSFIVTAGDSAVFVEDEEIVKIHVHTSDPGKVLSRAVTYGSLMTVKIENMRLQHSELIEDAEAPTQEHKKYAFVSVANGEGIASVFTDLGVDVIVPGGQSMNPSTDDILYAVSKVNADIVFIMPNNSNIIMVSDQAASIINSSNNGTKAIVIPSKSISQGIWALYAFDPEVEADENVRAMLSELAGVKSYSITKAVRDADIGGMKISTDQYLGLCENKVKIVTETISECADLLFRDMEGAECVMIFYGEDVTEEEAEKTAERARQICGDDTDISLINGGQPVYSYIIAGI